MAKYYFLASCLPPMPDSPGEKLLMPFSEICQLILRNIEPEDKPLVHSRLLLTDVTNIEFDLRSWATFIPGGILTQEEIKTRKNIPAFIRRILEDKEQGSHGGYQYDSLWRAYYHYAYAVAENSGCRFLIDYLSWEIGLRNSLVGLRAISAGKEPEDYRITVTPAAHDFSKIITQLKIQHDLMETERFLDSERLRIIYHFEGPDPFSRDAILGILEKARIFSRWERSNVNYEIQNII